MFELCKLLWDIVVLRDAARKGRLNWRIWLYGFSFVLAEYAIALPAVLLYEKHPQYKPVFVIAMVLVVINAVLMTVWAYRWQSRNAAEREAVPQDARHPLEPGEQVTVPSSADSRSDINRAMIIVFAMFCTFAGLAQTQAHAQSLYKDPAGMFTVMLPTDWQTQQEPGSQMVSFFDQKSQAFVYMGVVRENEASTPTADVELEKVRSHLAGNCPEAKIQDRGLTTLDGIRGTFFLVRCTNSKGDLETMKFAMASMPGLLLVITSGSPALSYETALPDIDSIEHSLKLLPSAAQVQPTERAQSAETSQDGGQSSAPAPAGSGMYSDPGGRYSLTVPDGWSAEPQAKSGTLQLSSGANWAMILAGGGGEPREVNHQLIQQIQAQFTGFQLLNEGELKVNGHPSHGTNATGVNPKGERVSVLVLTISAGNGHFLTVISSSPNDQAKTVNATIMQMAQSIRFGGE